MSFAKLRPDASECPMLLYTPGKSKQAYDRRQIWYDLTGSSKIILDTERMQIILTGVTLIGMYHTLNMTRTDKPTKKIKISHGPSRIYYALFWSVRPIAATEAESSAVFCAMHHVYTINPAYVRITAV